MHDLEKSSAAKVWGFFEEICAIPHGSGNEKGLSDFLKKWAEGKGLAVSQDSALNVLMRAPGSPGYENSPTLVLQGHIDMVCEKNGDVKHDFLSDPICVKRDGDFLRADGTTLGADNGIGLAMTLAVLDSDIPHPPIEAIFTTGEEVGMLGATAFDMKQLKGRLFLNLDTEEEGVFIVSNAGGKHAKFILPAAYQPAGEGAYFKLELTGLQGGHSGMDIDKERGHANRLMGRTLYTLREELPALTLGDMQAGSKENAMPRENRCIIGIPKGSEDKLQALCESLQQTFRHELCNTDAAVELKSIPAEKPAQMFTGELRDKVIAALLLIPNGVLSMSTDIPGLVETSNNLGVVVTGEEDVTFIYAIRSSLGSRKAAVAQQIEALAALLGARTEVISDYPAWEYKANSKLRDTLVACYKQHTGKEPTITAVHCGLECGIFSDAIEGLDVLSVGPDLHDVHSPAEHVSISSTERTWEFLQAALAALK